MLTNYAACGSPAVVIPSTLLTLTIELRTLHREPLLIDVLGHLTR